MTRITTIDEMLQPTRRHRIDESAAARGLASLRLFSSRGVHGSPSRSTIRMIVAPSCM